MGSAAGQGVDRALQCAVRAVVAVDIPNYRVVEKLGVGAQTRVFRARCMRTGKDYAVKIVKVINPEDASFIDLMRNEHAIGSTVDHPVLRKVYELRMLRRRLRVTGAILFMEYVEGITLADKEYRGSLQDLLHVFIESAKGLQAMHRANFVHADLKPNNIMVTTDGAVKLIDLGQSSKMNEPKPRIQGTPDYMAPEQVRRGVLDARTDVFGLGATLHKMLTGVPIKTEINKAITVHSQNMIGRRMDDANGDGLAELPSSVARLLFDCCQYHPEDRIPDMGALIQRLELVQTIVAKKANGMIFEGEDDDEDAWADEDEDDVLETPDFGDELLGDDEPNET